MVDVALYEGEIRVRPDISQVRLVARIGERVQDNNPIVRVFAEQEADKMGADKTRPAGHDQCLHSLQEPLKPEPPEQPAQHSAPTGLAFGTLGRAAPQDRSQQTLCGGEALRDHRDHFRV